MQSGAVLCLPLFGRDDSSAEVSDLRQFLLDGLKAFQSLTMGNLSLRVALRLAAILFVRFLKSGNLRAETSNLFSKDSQVIHPSRITYSRLDPRVSKRGWSFPPMARHQVLLEALQQFSRRSEFFAFRSVNPWVVKVKRFQSLDDSCGHDEVGKPFVVRWNNVPRRMLG